MMAMLMVYLTVVSALLGVAALLLEKALLGRHLPIRWVWAGAAVGGFAVPAFAAFRGGVPSTVGGVAGATFVGEGIVVLPAEPGVLSQLTRSIDLSFLGMLDIPLLVLWVAGSALMAALIVASQRALAQSARAWRRELIDGQEVWVSADVGPAAVGVRRITIVLPEWVHQLSTDRRRLMLLHEREHVAAGDSRLLMSGLALLVLAPWNPALWWKIRRLRTAIEIDCDARVLRRCGDVRAYGSLLLEVGQRTLTPPLAAVTLTHPAGQLERRIRMLLDQRNEGGWSLTLLLTVMALALGLAACEVEPPDPTPRLTGPVDGVGAVVPADDVDVSAEADPDGADPADPADQADSAEPAGPVEPSEPNTTAASPDRPAAAGAQARDSQEPVFTPMEVRPALRNGGALAAALADRYPPHLKDAGVGGTTVLWVQISDSGLVTGTHVFDSSGHPEFDRTAADLIQDMAQFTPAMNRGQPVGVWIQLPVRFEAAL